MKLIATFLIATCAITAGATGLESLESFVKTVKTGRSDFTQTVTVPGREGQAARSKVSSGTFEFIRPGLFRFVYKKPFEQTIVADGQTLWLYDVDLNQVTARKQSQVLGSTPAALVASAADMRALEQDFVLSADADQDGIEWVRAVPKTKDSALQTIRVGFQNGALVVLEIVDSFGQRSNLRFTSLVANKVIDPATFQFKPPVGVDVIRQ